MPLITKLPGTIEAEWQPVAREKVVSGDPETRTLVLYENPAEGLSAGEWEATVGAWRIAYSEWEYIRVLSGHCIVHGDDGSRVEAGPGESFTIESGFTGIWEVTETMRKIWVIREV